MNRFLLGAGLCYLALVCVVVLGLIAARQSANQNFSSSDARQAWDEWRESTKSPEQSDRPVRRSVPRSIEPPTLVLLRDHFGVCAAAAICITSSLFWTTAIFFRGVAAGPTFTVELRPSEDKSAE